MNGGRSRCLAAGDAHGDGGRGRWQGTALAAAAPSQSRSAAWPAPVQAAMFKPCRLCSSILTYRAAGRGTQLHRAALLY